MQLPFAYLRLCHKSTIVSKQGLEGIRSALHLRLDGLCREHGGCIPTQDSFSLKHLLLSAVMNDTDGYNIFLIWLLIRRTSQITSTHAGMRIISIGRDSSIVCDPLCWTTCNPPVMQWYLNNSFL